MLSVYSLNEFQFHASFSPFKLPVWLFPTVNNTPDVFVNIAILCACHAVVLKPLKFSFEQVFFFFLLFFSSGCFLISGSYLSLFCFCSPLLSFLSISNHIPLPHSEWQHQAGSNEQVQGQHHRHEPHRQQPPAEHPVTAQHLHQPTQTALQQHPRWVALSCRFTLW